jgi:hypothetical protein
MEEIISNSNFYTNLSALNWKPVRFSILSNQLEFKENDLLFDNGMFFKLNEMLKECYDYTSNNKTGFFLTDLTKAKDFLKDKGNPEDSSELKIIKSPLGTYSSNLSSTTVVKLSTLNNRLFSNLVTSDNINFNDSDVFEFMFFDDGYVMVKNKFNYYLTSKLGSGTNNLTFEPKISPEDQSQQFDYLMSENSISLFEIDDENEINRFEYAIITSPQTNGIYVLSSLSYLTSADKFPINASFDLLSYNKSDEKQNNVKDSFLAKYVVSPLDEINELIIDDNIKNLEYKQNYIAIYPDENAKERDEYFEYPMVVHSLKNYQTPEYKYSFGADLVEGQEGLRRIYDQIFSGTNQARGTKNLYLSFTSNTQELLFKSDTVTPFFFPPTAETYHISECGLIEDGAIPGDIPYISDRIFQKRQNYKELIPDSPQPRSIISESNTWLCSWLSGNFDGEKKWMDRYYNAAYYTLDQALSTKAMVYHDKLYAEKDYTYDIPSEMYLEPGVLYKYFHTGRQNRVSYLDYLSGISIIQITNWNSNNLKYDYQDYYGIVYYNKDENLKNDYIQLDGSNHVLFPATSEILENYKLTVSMWINVDDWNYIDGSQIFGNFYDSGYGLINKSSVTTPIITVLDNLNNTVYNFNYRFFVLNNKSLNFDYNKELISDNTFVQRLPNFDYWVFDKKNRTGIKFNLDNVAEVKINFDKNNELSENLSLLSEISQLEIDSKQNIYVYDNTTKICVSFSSNGDFLNRYEFESNINRIEIDLNDNLLPLYGTHSVIDNKNNKWEIVGGNLYKNKIIFGNIGVVEFITCDAENNLWILHGQDSISKIDIENNRVFSGYPKRIGKTSGLPEDPCFDYSKRRRYIDFIRVPRDKNSSICDETKKFTEDRVVLIDKQDNEIYILNQQAELISKLNLFAVTSGKNSNILADGDFTGYSYLRKFASVDKSFEWKIKISHPNGKYEKLLTLPIEVGGLSKGWHLFTMTFDSEYGVARSYIDSMLNNEQFFDKNTYHIQYKYRTSIFLGVETVRNTTLNDLIAIDDAYKFIGKISELKVYNRSLSKSEIEQVYYSSRHVNQDRDLIWNTPIGERNYIEEIQHWFKMQLPGSKSKYYNINIFNFKANDDIKLLIENSIRENIYKISPANTELYKINWI